MADYELNWSFGDSGTINGEIKDLLAAGEKEIRSYHQLAKNHATLTDKRLIYLSTRGLIDNRPDVYCIPLTSITMTCIQAGAKDEIKIKTLGGTINITFTKNTDARSFYKQLSRAVIRAQ